MLECGLAAAPGSTYTCAGDKLIWFVLSPVSEISFHQCCVPAMPLRKDSVSCQKQWWHLQGAWVWMFILSRWGILAAEGHVLCRERHSLCFLLAGTLRSHYAEPEEFWTLGCEDEYAIRLQGSCLELTVLKRWGKGEYRLMLPTTDLASVTEQSGQKIFPYLLVCVAGKKCVLGPGECPR